MALAINIVLGANTVNFSRNIQKATKKAEQELKGFAGFAQKAFDRINAGTLIGAGTLTTIVAAADKMQSLASKVKLATDSAEQFTAVQNQLRNIANEQRSSFEGVVDLYSSSQRALSQLGKSQQDVIGFTRNMTMAMNLGGGSAQAQAAALTQLGQALGSGALRGDEFNSVAEQAPILMELIAKKMGVATSALRDLAKEGKITADVVYDAVSGSTAALEAMTSKTAFTMASGFQVVKDNFGYLVHDIINETTGIAGAISDVLAFVGQNLKTIATIAGLAAAAIGVKMVQGWLAAKFGADGFNASLVRNLTALRTATVATVQSAYSMQNYAVVAGRVGLALDYAKMSVSAFGVSVFGGGVMAVEKASLAMTHLTATLTAYRTQLQATWVTTQAYIAQNFTLANAKAVVTASFATATTAVTGYITAKRTAIANTIAYIQSQSLLTHGKNLLTGSVRLATGGITGFIGAVRAGTVSVAGYTRAIVTSTIAKRAFVGTATLASTAVGKLGTAFAAVGRIIMAHPIMIIGGIIAAIVVRTMGLQKAMQSLSDAFAIAGDMLGQLIDWGVDGFKSMLDGANRFLSSFDSSSDSTISQVSGYFGSFFQTSHTGFVGILHVAAKVADQWLAIWVGTIKTIWQNIKALLNGIRNGFVRAVNAVTGAIAGIANAVAGVVNSAIDNINGLIDGAADLAAKAGINIGGRIGHVKANYQGTQIAVTQDDTNLTFAENIKNSNYGIAVGAFEKGVAALNKNKKAQDAANNAMNKGAAAADKAAKAAGGKGKADKGAANAAKQNKEAQDELAKALQSQRQEWEKLRYEMAHPMNLEIDKVNWEIQNGKFSGLSGELKEQLRNEARSMDIDIIHDELDKLMHDNLVNSMSLGVEGKFAELANHLNNSRHKFSLLKNEVLSVNEAGEQVLKTTGKLGQALAQAAQADWMEYSYNAKQSMTSLDKELAVVTTSGDFTKQLLGFEKEYQATLDKYAALKLLEDDSYYNKIQQQAKSLQLHQEAVATQSAYQNILTDLQDEESKKLASLENQLDIIAKQHELMATMPGMTSPIDASAARMGVLNKALDLPQPQLNAFDALSTEHQTKLMMISAFLEKQKKLYKDNADELVKIEREATAAKLEVDKYYQSAKNELMLTTLSEQSAMVAEGVKTAFGEQSSAYRAMFALQQSFVIGTAMLNIHKAISDAFAQGTTLAEKFAGIATATAQGMKIIAAIRQIRNPVVGQAHDGIMSVPKSGTWNLEKGERVSPKHTAKALDDRLDKLGNGASTQNVVVNVTVNNDGGDVQSSHEMGKSLGNAIKLAVQSELQKERRQGGILYGR